MHFTGLLSPLDNRFVLFTVTHLENVLEKQHKVKMHPRKDLCTGVYSTSVDGGHSEAGSMPLSR